MCGTHRGRVDAPRRLDTGRFVRLLDVEPSDGDSPDLLLLEPRGKRSRGVAQGELGYESADLLDRHAAGEGDFLDTFIAQLACEAGGRRAPQPFAIDDDFLADDAEDQGVTAVEGCGRDRAECLEASSDDRVIRSIERRSTDGGSQPPDEVIECCRRCHLCGTGFAKKARQQPVAVCFSLAQGGVRRGRGDLLQRADARLFQGRRLTSREPLALPDDAAQ